MKFFLVEQHDPDYWGGAGSGVLRRIYVRAMSKSHAESYCKETYFKHGHWRATEINFEEAYRKPIRSVQGAFGLREQHR